jgi:subtilisin family serine protease
LAKPDFTAADGVTTTPPGFAPFFGTSAAAPHAGAIAALVLSYNPGLTPAQVRTVLTNSCIDIMAPGWDRDSGFGILMALAALQNTPPVIPTNPPPNIGITTYSNRPVVLFPTPTGRGYLVQMTSNLSNGTWVTVTNGVSFSGLQVTNAPSPAFFRLIYQ